MALTYGFYDSLNHDRLYNAQQMSAIFDGIINDGVFMSVGNQLHTVAGSGMQVIVKSGRAWFNSTWTLNDQEYPLTISAADVLLTRIDAVVLEVNSEQATRANSLKIVKGTPASTPAKPTLTNTSTVHQHALAYVTVAKNTSAITSSMIEIVVGKTETPYVTAILQTTDITDLFNQWEDQFTVWFETVKGTLDGDVALNLQNQIDHCVKKADKATSADIEAGTADKWVDASLFSTKKYDLGSCSISFFSPDSTHVICNGEELPPSLLYTKLISTNTKYNSVIKKTLPSDSWRYETTFPITRTYVTNSNLTYDESTEKIYSVKFICVTTWTAKYTVSSETTVYIYVHDENNINERTKIATFTLESTNSSYDVTSRINEVKHLRVVNGYFIFSYYTIIPGSSYVYFIMAFKDDVIYINEALTVSLNLPPIVSEDSNKKVVLFTGNYSGYNYSYYIDVYDGNIASSLVSESSTTNQYSVGYYNIIPSPDGYYCVMYYTASYIYVYKMKRGVSNSYWSSLFQLAVGSSDYIDGVFFLKKDSSYCACINYRTSGSNGYTYSIAYYDLTSGSSISYITNVAFSPINIIKHGSYYLCVCLRRDDDTSTFGNVRVYKYDHYPTISDIQNDVHSDYTDDIMILNALTDVYNRYYVKISDAKRTVFCENERNADNFAYPSYILPTYNSTSYENMYIKIN